MNPYPFTLDNKRYTTWNYYLQKTYNQKVFKVPLDGGFTCPNRDGTKGIGGCTFCSAKGSGDTILEDSDLLKQYENGKEMMRKKWPTGKTIPYFQSFSNTYAPLSKIKRCIEPFLQLEEVCAIAIATRPDCLSNECIEYLSQCCQYKDIWLELGLQTIHDHSATHINRGHNCQDFSDAMERLRKTPIKTCVHIMNGLPYETEQMMIETAQFVNSSGVDAVKIHMLHLLKGTVLAEQYKQNPFPLLTRQQYVDIVCQQLQYLNPSIIIQRLTGDGLASELIAPDWTLKKTIVLNEIDKKMAKENIVQGEKAT